MLCVNINTTIRCKELPAAEEVVEIRGRNVIFDAEQLNTA